MVTFSNPFFSIAGQKERLANAGNTVLAAITGKGVVSNTGQKQVDAVLGFAASNPFLTAVAGAIAANPSAAAGTLKAGYAALSPGAKVASVVAAPVVVGAVASNPKLITKTAKAPSELASFGSDLGNLLEDPSLSNAAQVVKNSPLISAGIAAGGAALIGGGIAGTIATIQNTKAIKKNTATSTNPVSSPGLPPIAATSPGGGAGSMVPLTRETMVLGREVSSGSTVRRVRRSKPRSNAVSVRILNQNTYIGRGA